MTVTQSDLLDALRSALDQPTDETAPTGPELQEQLGVAAVRVSKMLRQIQADGRLEVVTVRRRAIDGRLMTLKGYRIKGKPKK